MSQYPSPDQIELPEPDEISPDQSYYLGWLVQHARLWLVVAGLGVLNVLLVVALLVQGMKFEPSVQYVTLEGGGYPVLWNERGNPVIDDVEYVPARMRAVVRTFIENRYGYDYQNLSRLNSALRLMSDEAREAELAKIDAIDLRTNVVQAEMKVALNIDWTNWDVVSQGDGVFQVTVAGEALITDAFRNPDPDNPMSRPFSTTLVVRTVPASDTNPLGYQIISTGRDIIF